MNYVHVDTNGDGSVTKATKGIAYMVDRNVDQQMTINMTINIDGSVTKATKGIAYM